MNAEALNQIAAGLEQAAAGIRALTSGSAGVGPSSPAPAPAAFNNAQPQAGPGEPPGVCPVHQTAWTYKPGGTSQKTGKPYSGFWKCDGKDADGNFCQERPPR